MKKLIVILSFVALMGCATTNQQAGKPTSHLKAGETLKGGPQIDDPLESILYVVTPFLKLR